MISVFQYNVVVTVELIAVSILMGFFFMYDFSKYVK